MQNITHIFYTNKIWTFIIFFEIAFDALVLSLLVHLSRHLLHEKLDMEGRSILVQAEFCNLKSKQKVPEVRTPYVVRQLKRI